LPGWHAVTKTCPFVVQLVQGVITVSDVELHTVVVYADPRPGYEHVVQAPAPELLKVPVPQALQLTAPAAAYVPAAQLLHELLLVGYCPAPQDLSLQKVEEVEPVTLVIRPAGQL